ncbi:Ema19 protein [Pichia kluyveri]|uniref:Efficient mitochondria targeting-associated protein 19 n=1 Tax=Pichia kluyveri TaxID=36015 RepID=A0AAV5R1U8_PICKL|nr:Ema19 protein [Pichia kluyveri]
MDTVYFIYFLIHIPITLLMDATFVIPTKYQINIQKTLSEFHIEQNKDFLAIETPLWIQIFVLFELIFQVPIFFYAVYHYLNNNKSFKFKSWIYLVIYGFNAGFTTLVCFIYVIMEGNNYGLNNKELINLLSLYTPTMLLPFYMMIDFSKRINNQLNIINNINIKEKTK